MNRPSYSKPKPTREHWRTMLGVILTMRASLDGCEHFIDGWAKQTGTSRDHVLAMIDAERAVRAAR